MSNMTAVETRTGSDRVLPRLTTARPTRKLRSSVAGRLRFLGAFLREPLTVGAFWPSSPALAELIVDGCDLHLRETVVELGPGSGAFTGMILERLRKSSRFLAIEISQLNVRELRRCFPSLEVYRDSAENLSAYLTMHGRRKADCIVCGLAWGNMLPATQNRIFDVVLNSLAPGGLFTMFAYVHALWFPTSFHFRQRLLRRFTRIETTPIIWRNLPPAFVYRCWREK